MDILNPQEGDTHTVNGVTFRVKTVIQDSVEYEILEGTPTPTELEACYSVMAQQWYEALPRIQLQRLQELHGRKSNENRKD